MSNRMHNEDPPYRSETASQTGSAWHAGRRAFLAGGLAAIAAAAVPQSRTALGRLLYGLRPDSHHPAAFTTPIPAIGDPPPFTLDELERIQRQIHDDCQKIVSKPGALDATRRALLADIWRSSEPMPDRLGVTALPDNPPPNARMAALENTSESRVFDIDTGRGFNSVVRYLRPSKAVSRQNRLMIVHQGHGDPGVNGTDTAALRFLSNGFDVLFCGMPMSRENRWPANVSVAGGCGHEGMAILENAGFNPLELFFNHLPTAIRTAQELNQGDFSDMSICGISGGAWTATVYAALDPRIRFSFSVAGTSPHILLRDGGRSMYENGVHQSIYAICPLHVMYLLGIQVPESDSNQTANRPRGQVQFYNECERLLPVNAAHYSFPIKYVKPVCQAAQLLGGLFSISIHFGQSEHLMGDPHIENMLDTTRGEYLKVFGHNFA